MAQVTFELVTDFQILMRRDFEIDSNTIDLDPAGNSALQAYAGEYLQIDSNYKLTRSVTTANAGLDDSGLNNAQVPNFALYVERGRYDVRGVGKQTVLWSAGYEADTLCYGGAPALGLKLAVTAVKADYITGTPIVRGLMDITAQNAEHADTVWHGYVTKVPASNGNKLRYVCIAP